MEKPVEIERLAGVLDHANDETAYLLRLDNAPAKLVGEGFASDGVPLFGEILIGATRAEDRLVLKSVSSLSLWTGSFEPLKGEVALAGPNRPPVYTSEAGGAALYIEKLQTYLYYPELGSLPQYENGDGSFAVLETLIGKLSIEPAYDPDSGPLKLRVSFHLELSGQPALGRLTVIEMAPHDLLAMPLVAWDGKEPLHHSLTSSPQSPPAGTGKQVREVRLRWINLSSAYSTADPLLEMLANDQMDGAGEVWMAKAGIRATPDAAAILPNPDPTFNGVVNYGLETDTNLNAAVSGLGALWSGSAVEVFLVDRLTGNLNNPRRGGGVTKLGGSNQAYIFLEIGKAMERAGRSFISLNRFLLAHELGHVLGVDHPAYPGAASSPNQTAGSENSVMVPDRPCSARNTLNNMNQVHPLGSVFQQVNLPNGNPWGCQWNPDSEVNFYHVVRDFPYDDGTPNIAPRAPVQYRWTHSDVWNSWQDVLPEPNDDEVYLDATTSMMLSNFSPNAKDPRWSGDNFMLVRLHAGQRLATTPAPSTQPTAYLFLAKPGAPLDPLINLTPNGLQFSLGGNGVLRPGFPRTMGVKWSIPVGYPNDFCVFAVVVSPREFNTNATPAVDLNTIINNAASRGFYDLFRLIGSDNDVSQRNLHIHQTGAGGGSLLPWIALSNPLGWPDRAELEIEFPEQPNLNRVQLEIDNRRGQVIAQSGRPLRLVLWRKLAPKVQHILRLRVPEIRGEVGDAPVPIDLRLFVNKKLITGFRHEVRVSPLEQVSFQVLDGLCGALFCARAAFGPAFEKIKAVELPERAAELARLAEYHPEEALARLGEMCGAFQELGSALSRRNAAARVVRRELRSLSSVVVTRNGTIFDQLEEIRERAERIQEPSGRVVARLLLARPPGQKGS